MPVVVCPHCQTNLDIPAKYIGMTGKCKHCGRRFKVPDWQNGKSAAPEHAPETPRSDEPSPAAYYRRAPSHTTATSANKESKTVYTVHDDFPIGLSLSGTIWIPQAIAILMVLYAIDPMEPDIYFNVLRWGVCGVFAYLTIQAIIRMRYGLAWALGISAMIYNPFFPLDLTVSGKNPFGVHGSYTKMLWLPLVVSTLAILIVSVFMLSPGKRNNL